jgi:hypothetical protein
MTDGKMKAPERPGHGAIFDWDEPEQHHIFHEPS